MKSSLHILMVGGPMYNALYGSIAEFEAREKVRVEVTCSSNHPDLNVRIQRAFTQSHGYDLISTHSKFAPAQKGWLSPLDDDFSSSELANFNPDTLELARINGQLYGIPRNLDIKLLHYRTDWLGSAPATWESLVQTAQSLTKGQPYGFVFPGHGSGLFGHFFELCGSAGAYIYGQETPIPKVNNPAGRWALETLRTLQAASPPEVTDWEFDQVSAFFRSGKAAMTTDWPGSFQGYLESEIASQLGLALYPSGPVRRATYSGSHTFAVGDKTRDRPLAIALLKFLSSKESQLLEARGGTLPARLDALEAVKAEVRPGSLQARRWELLSEAIQYRWVPPKHPNYPAVEAILWQNVQAFLKGQQSADETLGHIEREGEKAARGLL